MGEKGGLGGGGGGGDFTSRLLRLCIVCNEAGQKPGNDEAC